MNAPTQDNNNPAFTFNGREKLPLPLSYTPSSDVFIVGRGRKVYEHQGNRNFRELIDGALPEYKQASTKGLKSAILWQILKHVRRNSTNGLGFVKKEAGRWHAIDDASARINIAQAFRDRLSADYRSSKQHKSIKRKVDLGIPLTTSDEETVNSYNCSHYSSDSENERPVKRVCMVGTNDKLEELPVDNTMSVLSSMNMKGLRVILNASSKIAPPSQYFLEGKINVDASKTFENLFRKFGTGCDSLENPFEPKPIALEPLKGSALFANPIADAIFPTLLSAKSTEEQPLQFQDEFEPLPVRQKASRSFSISTMVFGEIERCSSISDLSINQSIFDESFENVFEAALSA